MFKHANCSKSPARILVRGFTLIETLVSITILTLAITGPMTIAARSIQATRYAKDSLIATFLAQDALEFMIAKKDYNIFMLGIDEWRNGMVSDGTYCVDSTTGLDGGLSNNPCLLRFANGLYQPATGDPTPFTRSVEVETLSAGEVRLTARVAFPGRTFSGDRTVEIVTNIFQINR